MPTASQQVIDAVVRRSVAPLLKAEGFARRGRTWNRPRREFVDVVGIQASRWNTPLLTSCTVNLGVFIPSIYRAVQGTEPPVFVGDALCPLRTRIGRLTDDHHDLWWRFDPRDGGDAPESDIGDIIRDVGLPFFGRFTSLADVHGWIEASGQMSVPVRAADGAAIKLALDDPEGAHAILQKAYQAPLLREWLRTVAGRLGVTLADEESGAAPSIRP